MEILSLIAMKDGATPPDVSRGEIINITAPWPLVEGLAKLVLARYPEADCVIAVDSMGYQKGAWQAQEAAK